MASVALLWPTGAAAQSFSDALASAYRSNPRLLSERTRVREADETYVQARAGGRVNANLSAELAPSLVRTPNTGFFGTPEPGTNTDYVTSRRGSLQIVQPIYTGGRVRGQKRQARAGVMAARENLRQAEQSTLLDAANAYLDVRRNEEAASIRRRNVMALLRQEEASTVRFEVGEGTRTDIAQAQTRLEQARIGLAQADAELAVSRAAFVRAVGYPPAELEPVPQFVIPGSVEEAIRIGLDNNPQVLAAYHNQQAADANVTVAKSASRPNVNLNATLSALRDQLGGLSTAESAQLTASVTVPLYAGGANRSRVRQAEYARTRAGFEARDIERALVQTVSGLFAQLEAARETVRASGAQVGSAEVAFEGVELEQQVGTRTALDVLDAEQELLLAQLNAVDAERQRDLAVFQLLSALGAFTADGLQLPVDHYDPRRNFDAATYTGADRYIPEALVKIGPQLPDIAEGVVDALDAVEILDAGEKIIEQLDDAGAAAVESLSSVVDGATGQGKAPPAAPVPGMGATAPALQEPSEEFSPTR